MTKELRNLVLTASVLASAIILVFIQIPFLGMGIDLSLVAILIGRRYIGYGYSILICLLYPWVSSGFMGPIGAFFIVLQAMGIVTLDLAFNKDRYSFFGILMVVLLGTLWSLVVNFLVIVPMYWYLAGETFGNVMGQYNDYSESFLKFEMSWLITGAFFNPIKLSFAYAITIGIWIGLENSVNTDINQDWIDEQETNKEIRKQNTELAKKQKAEEENK